MFFNFFLDTINLYLKPNFADKAIQLFVNTVYNSMTLPMEIFSSSFSLEIPPGFEFVIDKGNNNVETFDNDNAQMSPINSLTSTIFVKVKPGLIIYEQPAYFSSSEFVDKDISSNSFPIGSVIVPEGFRGIIWSNSNFTGNNLGLFEPIANFTGISVTTKQEFPASLDVEASKKTYFI
jgi:hypothetical protein